VVKIPSVPKKYQVSVLLFLSVVFLWAVVIYLPMGISALRFDFDDGIKEPFIAEQMSNDPTIWETARDDALVFFALGDTGTGEEG
jgi:hypothetical protein